MNVIDIRTLCKSPTTKKKEEPEGREAGGREKLKRSP
jgi:hypothetical protein